MISTRRGQLNLVLAALGALTVACSLAIDRSLGWRILAASLAVAAYAGISLALRRVLDRDERIVEAIADGLASLRDQDYSVSVSPPDDSPALERLAAVLERELDDDERLLVVWMSNCAPSRDIARWLGIAYKAAAKRIERLRERLQTVALRHVETTDGDERRELLGFLGRAALASRPAARLAAVRDGAQETA
jgi:hypothetical protein